MIMVLNMKLFYRTKLFFFVIVDSKYILTMYKAIKLARVPSSYPISKKDGGTTFSFIFSK